MKTINPIHNIKLEEMPSGEVRKDPEVDKKAADSMASSNDFSVDSVLSATKARKNLDLNAVYPNSSSRLNSGTPEKAMPAASNGITIYVVGYYMFAIVFLIANFPAEPLSGMVRGDFSFDGSDTLRLLVFFAAIGLLFRKEWARLVAVVCLTIITFLSILLILLYSGVGIVNRYVIFQAVLTVALLIFLNLPRVRELCE